MDFPGSSSTMMDMDSPPMPYPGQPQASTENVELEGKGKVPLPGLLRSRLGAPNNHHKAARHEREARMNKLRRSRHLAKRRGLASSERPVKDTNSDPGDEPMMEADGDWQTYQMKGREQDEMDEPMGGSDPGTSTDPIHRPWTILIRRAKEELKQRRLAESRSGPLSQQDKAAVKQRAAELKKRRQSKLLVAAQAQARVDAVHQQAHADADMDCLPDALSDLSLAQMDGASDDAPLRGNPQR